MAYVKQGVRIPRFRDIALKSKKKKRAQQAHQYMDYGPQTINLLKLQVTPFPPTPMQQTARAKMRIASVTQPTLAGSDPEQGRRHGAR